MTVYEFNPVKKIIVQSPQPSDVGELIEMDKICRDEKSKCKR